MSYRPFSDRRDAGRVLAGLLDEYWGRSDVIVLGLPRGGVPVAYEVATALGVPLDVDLVSVADRQDYETHGGSMVLIRPQPTSSGR